MACQVFIGKAYNISYWNNLTLQRLTVSSLPHFHLTYLFIEILFKKKKNLILISVVEKALKNVIMKRWSGFRYIIKTKKTNVILIVILNASFFK